MCEATASWKWFNWLLAQRPPNKQPLLLNMDETACRLFYDPAAGGVCIDGRDIKDLSLRWLRSHIGIVGQEPALFDCSIAENIRYAKPGATDQEIQQACRDANAYSFIKNLPKVSTS